jgi:hypothetical protein
MIVLYSLMIIYSGISVVQEEMDFRKSLMKEEFVLQINTTFFGQEDRKNLNLFVDVLKHFGYTIKMYKEEMKHLDVVTIRKEV